MTATAEELLRADDRRYERLMASEVAALDAMLTDDFTYTHFSGFIEGKADYLARIAQGAVTYGRGERLHHDVRIHGDTGIMTGHMRMPVHAPARTIQLDNLFLAVWLFEGGEWKLAAWASTANRPG
jgi:hypothetical protein